MTLRKRWQYVESACAAILRVVWVIYALGLALAVPQALRLLGRALEGDPEAWGALLGYVLAAGVLRWSYRWWRYGERLQVWRRVGRS